MTREHKRIATALRNLFGSAGAETRAAATLAGARYGTQWLLTILVWCLAPLSSALAVPIQTILRSLGHRGLHRSYRNTCARSLFGAMTLVMLYTLPAHAQDITPPVISGVSSNITQNTDASAATATVTFAAPTATDDVDGPVTPVLISSPTAGLVSGSAFPVGVTTMTYTATDAAGNIATASFTTTISDAELPVFSGVPSNIAQNTDAGASTATVTFTAPTVTDNVDGALTPVLVSSPTAGLVSGSAFPIGVTTMTYTATDAAGNVATANFTITISDAEMPVFSGVPSNIAQNTDAGASTATVTFTAPTATDNVDGAITPVLVSSPTAGLVSGSAFPIGSTTMTYTATDGAGNIASAAFTVTVADNQAPAFTSFPANISIDVDYPATSAVASWTEPTASDNSGAVTITRTAGPASGSTFPLGSTLVTYEAEDGAGNKTSQSFTVTVAQIAPGQVTLVVESGADGSFPFTSPEPGLNFTINVVAGTGTSGPILIRPGSYNFAFSVPTGFGITGATCTDPATTIDTAAMTGTVVLVSGASVTCTISSMNSVAETTAQIGAFVEARAKLIIQNRPGVNRRLERLRSNYTNNGAVSGFAIAPASSGIPASIALSADQASFAYSLRKSQAGGNLSQSSGHRSGTNQSSQSTSTLMAFAQPTAASASAGSLNRLRVAFENNEVGRNNMDPMQYRTDIWVEGTIARIDAAGGDGNFGILHGGFDYLVLPGLLVGLGIQGDWTEHGTVSGSGYMAGPYTTVQLSNGLYLDARGAWGQSFNRISPLGTYSDEFDAERWLASAAIIGDFNVGAWNIRPAARVDYFNEKTDAYVDSLSVLIPSVAVTVGELTFGPTFTYTLQPTEGAIASAFVGIEGIWTFTGENTATTASPGATALADTGLRARAEAGLSINYDGGLSVSTSTFYDGIGNAGFSAWGGKARISKQF